MSFTIRAIVPLPEPTHSNSYSALGWSWRLSPHRIRPRTIAFKLTCNRQYSTSTISFKVSLRIPHSALRPVRNIETSANPSFHPQQLLHLPSHASFQTVKFPPLSVPACQHLAVLHLSVTVCVPRPSSSLPRYAMYHSDNGKSGCTPPPDSLLSSTSIIWINASEECTSHCKFSGIPAERHCPSEILNSLADRPFEPSDYQQSKDTPACNLSIQSCSISTSLTAVNDLKGCEMVRIIAGVGASQEEFAVPKSVLTTSSPVFNAMLSLNMQERIHGLIFLENWSPQCLKSAIRLLQVHELPHMSDSTLLVDLYKFAHHFDIQRLLQMVRCATVSNLSIYNAVQLTQLGTFFFDPELKGDALYFIAKNFSQLTSNQISLNTLHDLPESTFIELLDMDSIYATEMQVFFACLRWLHAQDNSVEPDKVLRNIRWSLMTPEMLNVALNSGFLLLYPSARGLFPQHGDVHKLTPLGRNKNFNGMRRRVHGRPTATVMLTVVSPPPQALRRSLAECNSQNLRRYSGHFDKDRRWKNTPLIHGEQHFEFRDLAWTFRAELSHHGDREGNRWRLAVRLWIEEDVNGEVWTISQGRGKPVGFPIQLQATCMVFDTWGGRLHSCDFSVCFQCSGWANGWCIQDVFDERDGIEALFSDIRGCFGVGVLQVAIEMRKCVST